MPDLTARIQVTLLIPVNPLDARDSGSPEAFALEILRDSSPTLHIGNEQDGMVEIPYEITGGTALSEGDQKARTTAH